jgi:hypothetical protein
MKKYDLLEDIRNSREIMAKIRAKDKRYAQNLYAAWCNMQWCPRDIIPALRQGNEDLWHCTWRTAGGIVADLRNKGEDYMDYYCSGMRGGLSYDSNEDDDYFEKTGYVPEGDVTDEIAKDLASIGWFPVPYKDEDLI